MRDLADLHSGTILPYGLAQAVFDSALVLLRSHVDEVDHDETAQVTDSQLPGDLVRCLHSLLWGGGFNGGSGWNAVSVQQREGAQGIVGAGIVDDGKPQTPGYCSGDGSGHLKQQGRLPDPGFAGNQYQRSGHQPAAAADKLDIAWGGSNPGGVMYYMVGAAGTVISEKLPQYNITQVTTGGSTENCKRLLKGELDMGIVYGPHVYMALNQQGPFKDFPKGTMLRGVAKAYEGASYVVTLPDSDIKSMNDLVGKKVALGPPGSGTVFNSSNVLRALGLLDKIKPEMMSFADAGRAVENRQIDACSDMTSIELQTCNR